MGFSESVGMFPLGWYRSVQGVAVKSPLLLSMGAGQYLDKELELNRPLKIDNIGQVGRGAMGVASQAMKYSLICRVSFKRLGRAC